MKVFYKTDEINQSQYQLDCDVWFASGKIGPEPIKENYSLERSGEIIGSYLNPEDPRDPWMIINDHGKLVTCKLSKCTIKVI